MMLVAFFVPSVSQDVVALLKKLQIPAGGGAAADMSDKVPCQKSFSQLHGWIFEATWMSDIFRMYSTTRSKMMSTMLAEVGLTETGWNHATLTRARALGAAI